MGNASSGWAYVGGGGGAGSLAVSAGGGTSNNVSGLTFANSNGVSFGLSTGAGVGTITASVAGASAGVAGILASNTTYTSGSVSFSNANGITFGSSAGQAITASYNSTQFAGTASSITGSLSITMNSAGIAFNGSNLVGNNTAKSGAIAFTANSSGISINATSLAGTATAITGNASITLNTAGLSFNGTNLAGVGTTITGNASITMNSAGIQFNGSGLAGTNTGATNASLTVNSSGVSVSVPAPSSISATGWASISVNGSTISVGAAAPQLSFYQPIGPIQATTITQNGNNSIQVYPAIAAFPFTASRVDMLASVSAAALAASTEAQTLSMYVGLYSLNGSTLSLATSGSQSYAWTNSSGGSSSVLTGLRRFSAPMNVNYTGGFDLFVGVMSNTTFVNTNGISVSNVVVAVAPVAQLNGLIGETTNNSKQLVPGQGFFSTTSAAMPVSMGLSAISGIGSASVNAYAVPVQFVNVTA